MRLTFIGAAGEVTGSATLVDTGRSRILVDFGMFQGSPVAESRNRRPPDGSIDNLDAVVLTHAHIDHAGRLPLLVRDKAKGGGGYRGSIWATPATIELAAMMLRDSAEIQESDAARWMRHRARRGRITPAAPLYTVADVEQAVRQMRPLPYEQTQEIASGVSLHFIDAGHILGSASVRLHCRAAGSERTIVFSGDIGVPNSPILRDPRTFDAADTVILESTYGDRNHLPMDQTIDQLSGVLNICKQGCGKILIPAFAVGRTQTLVYLIGRLREEGKAPRFPVYVDSPMASEATALYRAHTELYDTISREMLGSGDSPLSFQGLRFTRSGDESRRLNEMEGPIAIISASGMCTGGRILHHLRHNLWKESTHLLFVGYQAQGTLGRALVEGTKNVRIMHEPISVKARIHTIGGLSAHAGQDHLAAWMKPLAGGKPRILLNHGENTPRQALRLRLNKDYGLDSAAPQRGETVEV